METLYLNTLCSIKEFNQAKGNQTFSLVCPYCKKTFYLKKWRIKNSQCKKHRKTKDIFCSKSCAGLYYDPPIFINCSLCNKSVKKSPKEFKKSKNHFCSKSCAATYNNKHKTKGTRRSKLEKWLEIKLAEKYPSLKIEFNSKSAIQSELDIYIPSLNLAFELNGIFHYEPIYGIVKFQKIQTNDDNKFQACIKNGINLCIIDVSGQNYFKETTSQKYLDIICSIIDKT